MMNRILFSLSIALLFNFHFSTTLAQSPAASPAVVPVPTAAPPVPVPTVPLVSAPPLPTVPLVSAPPVPGTPDVIKILQKAGHFTLLLRLLKSTSVGAQINSQLKDSNNGLTIFAPSDNAFSGLKSGTLNSLTGQQQIQLLQFHILPTYLSTAQFQTATNPLRTQAGGSDPGQFPLNLTITGNQVNVSTGVMNTSITGTIYSDNKLALYQVDSVLLPWRIFGTPVPTAAPAPAPAKALAPALLTPANKTTPVTKTPSSSDNDASASASGAVSLTMHMHMHGMVVTIGVAVAASFLF